MTLSVTWNSLGRDEYEAAFAQAGRSPLTQAWAYGEAKRQEGWKVHRFHVESDGRAVALGQVLQRGSILRLGRLNRGPVWLEPPGGAVWGAILNALRRRWSVSRGGVLLLAPEIQAGADADSMLGDLWRRRAPAWSSAWLDLRPDPTSLRKNLNGKWRNMLVNAEKAGLSITSSGSMERLVEQYRFFVKDRAFQGLSGDLLMALAKQARAEDLLILEASQDDIPVAGILVARHGRSATYLIGWNTEEGRKTRANYLLLWRGLLEARIRDVDWLDLGGIDQIGTPGIASFKRGLNGVPYGLAGEFLLL